MNTPTPTQIHQKQILNSQYGAYSRGIGKSIFDLHYMSNYLNYGGKGIDINTAKHSIKNEYPFDYVPCNRSEELPMENMFEFISNHSIFPRRIDAEIERLKRLIKLEKSHKKSLIMPKQKFKGDRLAKRKFEGYPNTNALKLEFIIKKKDIDERIAKLNFELDNLAEEHPEWLI